MDGMKNLKELVMKAHRRISGHIRETPLEESLFLGKKGQGTVFLKCENYQLSGSFKIRGALNKLFSLEKSQLKQGLVTASSGNHGHACAYLLREFGYPGRIVLPENVSPAKLEALRLMGGVIELHGDDCVKAEVYARKSAVKNGQIFVSPYNDWDIIAGQGTVALEIHKQMESKMPSLKPDAVLVPVGGGGLISGIAGYLKSIFKNIEIIGCQPENSAVMYRSIRAGRILELASRPTLADGTAGGLEPESITFGLCRRMVDRFILISEEEIRSAIRLILEQHHMLVEGAAALSIAAFVKLAGEFSGKNVVLLLSGCKISMKQIKEILCGG